MRSEGKGRETDAPCAAASRGGEEAAKAAPWPRDRCDSGSDRRRRRSRRSVGLGDLPSRSTRMVQSFFAAARLRAARPRRRARTRSARRRRPRTGGPRAVDCSGRGRPSPRRRTAAASLRTKSYLLCNKATCRFTSSNRSASSELALRRPALLEGAALGLEVRGEFPHRRVGGRVRIAHGVGRALRRVAAIPLRGEGLG